MHRLCIRGNMLGDGGGPFAVRVKANKLAKVVACQTYDSRGVAIVQKFNESPVGTAIRAVKKDTQEKKNKSNLA